MKWYLSLIAFLLIFEGLAQFPSGVIIDSVQCKDTPGQSYALYLPSDYDDQKKYPVVFIFEPAARGTVPIGLMQPAAEKHKYILICSNTSRNGSWDLVFNAADAMLLDAQQRFSLDMDRFYTSGFSGGSRAALAIASITGKMRGVIGCGAGLPSNKAYYPEASQTFNYVGLVGKKDMNYREHRLLKNRLDEMGFNNILITSELGHQWADTLSFNKAFEWLELMAIKEGMRANEDFATKYKDRRVGEIDSLIQEEQILEASRYYDQLKTDLHPIYPIIALEERYAELRKLKAYKDQQKEDERISRKEDELIDRYLVAFSELYFTKLDTSAQKGYEWWENEVRYLRKLTGSNQVAKRNLGYRMLNLISARSAESCFRFVKQRDYEIAQILNELWIKSDRESVYAHWHMAKIYALQMDRAMTLNYLELAYERGMRRPESMENEQAFQFIRNEEEYQDILNRLKAN